MMFKALLLQSWYALSDPALEKQLARVEVAVNCMFNKINEELGRGGRIEIRGFGSFSIRRHEAKMGRNPRTGEAVSVYRKNSIHFKPGIDLRERVNASRSGHKII
jgi:integration host factor subunit beta